MFIQLLKPLLPPGSALLYIHPLKPLHIVCTITLDPVFACIASNTSSIHSRVGFVYPVPFEFAGRTLIAVHVGGRGKCADDSGVRRFNISLLLEATSHKSFLWTTAALMHTTRTLFIQISLIDDYPCHLST